MNDSQNKIKLYRMRHIPAEKLLLTGDEILYLDDTCLITRWNTIKPRKDFASGISLFDFQKHWKITRVAKADGSLYHWYCDIMNMHIVRNVGADFSTYTMEDLLIDITVAADGTVRILDLDEAADAFTQGLISNEDLTLALRAANELLRLIEHGGFAAYQTKITAYLPKEL